MATPEGLRTLHAASRTDFDGRFRVQTSADTRASVSAGVPCEDVITLATGVVDVWARDLEGGALRVSVGRLVVEVRGTRFRVGVADDAVTVSVAEGHVVVRDRGRVVADLRASQSVRIDARGVEHGVVSTDVRDALASLLHADAPTAARIAPAPETADAREPETRVHADADAARVDTDVGDDLVLDAERAQREGRLDEARALFRRAGRASSATGEAAWIRLARLELRAGRARDARAAIAEHDRRFRGGRLAAEALYVDATAARALGDVAGAAAAERTLLSRYPGSPQAARVRERMLE